MPPLLELLSDPKVSSYREQVLEQIFCSEILQAAWRADLPPLEIDRPFVDRAGYDLVVSAGPVTRHVQLKGLVANGRTRTVPVQRALADKPSPCVVLLLAHQIDGRLALSYRLTPPAGSVLDLSGFASARHPRRNAAGERPVRPGVVDLPLSAFHPTRGTLDADGLCQVLFTPRTHAS